MTFIQENKKEYSVYNGVKRRCYEKSNKAYPRYGGRGIIMHQSFLLPNGEGFKNFMACIGKRPDDTYSIDRINYRGNYAPGNIRWATDKEQANNTSANHYVEYEGRTQTLMMWCEELNLNYDLIQDRITGKGWTFERAITDPKNGSGSKSYSSPLTKEQVVEIFFSCEEYCDICEKYNISLAVISRIKNKIRYKEDTKDLGDPGRSENKYNNRKAKYTDIPSTYKAY